MWQSCLYLSALLCVTTINALCPNVCICDIDESGRKRTRCENGGVSIPGNVDLNQLDQDTQVLMVTGSPQRQNTFNLSPNMFMNKRFKEIHLSYSSLDYTGDSTFWGVQASLEVLNLTHNSLRAMGENNFKNLSRLTHLHLDYNRIASVHSAMFAFLTSLRVLTISNNFISDVPQRMGLQLAKLEVLDMSNNPIGVPVIPGQPQTIPENFFQDFPNLKVLNLANCSLESLPWDSIRRNNLYLQDLDLSGNKLNTILPGQLNIIRDLKQAKIGGNPIAHIAPLSLAGLRLDNLDLSRIPAPNVLTAGVFERAVVRNLDISYMDVRVLDQQVFQPIFIELIGLNVSGNPGLAILPNMFQMFPNLQTLTMQRMRPKGLPRDMFNYDNALKYIDLSYNDLVSLEPEFFAKMANVETLNLDHNVLQTVPNTVNLLRIQSIDLAANRLIGFPDNLVQSFASPASALKSLRLNQNPWNCDCGVASLGRWLVSDHANPGYRVVCQGNGNFSCPVCQEPATLRGTPLNQLPLNMLDTCSPADARLAPANANVDVIIAVVVCLIVLIIAILLLVLWYRNRLHSYRTYEEKRKEGDQFEHNGDVGDVFDEPVPPISKPKNGLPSAIQTAPPVAGLPKQESNV